MIVVEYVLYQIYRVLYRWLSGKRSRAPEAHRSERVHMIRTTELLGTTRVSEGIGKSSTLEAPHPRINPEAPSPGSSVAEL
jgi:hypothetical protein